MKYIATIILSLVLVTATTAVVAAEEKNASASATIDHKAGLDLIQQSKKATRSAEQLINLKQAGDKIIQARIDAINKLISRLNSESKLSSDDKASLLSDLNQAISGLQTLKSTVDNATSVDALKSNVKSVYDSYRVFAVLLPKVEGLSAVARMNGTITKLDAAEAKLATLVAKAASNGKDIQAMQLLLSDYQAKITDAKAKIAVAKTDFLAMKVNDPSGAKSLFEAGKNSLKTAKADLNAAHKDLQGLIPLLRSARGENKATGSATPAAQKASSSGTH